MNSASKGSMSRFVPAVLKKDLRAYAREVKKVTGVSVLLDKQVAVILKLFDANPGNGAGYRAFLDKLFDRRPLWDAFQYTFRFEPGRIPVLVEALRNNRRCARCGGRTSLSICCGKCLTLNPEEAKDVLYQCRTEKSQASLKARFGEQGYAHPEIVAKRKATNLRLYGVEHAAQNQQIKGKTATSWAKVDRVALAAKRKATNLELYGVEHAMQCPEVAHKTSTGLKKRFSDPRLLEERNRKARDSYEERTGYAHPALNPEVISKRKATSLSRTGYEHNMKDPEHRKAREDNYELKYGVRNAMQRPEIAQKAQLTAIERHGGLGKASVAIRAQIEATCEARYGVKVPTANPLIMAKCKATWLAKYGFEHPNQNPEQAAKGLRSSYRRIDLKVDGKEFTVQGKAEVKLLEALCKKYGAKKVYSQFSEGFPKTGWWTPDFWVKGVGYFECKSIWTLTMPSALDDNRAKAKSLKNCKWVVVHNKTLTVLPRNWYLTPNVEFVWQQALHDRTGKEAYCAPYVEIIKSWLPDAKVKQQVVYTDKVAVVFVPLYWEQDPRKMQALKDKAAASGRRLVFIYEHWLRLRTVATRNFVRNLAGEVSKSVMARKCEVVVKRIADVKPFLNIHHIQGTPKSGKAYCLLYEGRLVGCMVFNHTTSSRGSKKKEGFWELTRYATSLNIPGGASKLLTAFQRQNVVKSIVSYSDSTVFTGAMYKALGFEKTKETKQDYMAWTGGLQVLPKQAYAKKQLEKNWPDYYDPELTERQNCELIGLRVVRTLGKIRWELTSN